MDLLRGNEEYKYRLGAVDRWDETWIRPGGLSGSILKLLVPAIGLRRGECGRHGPRKHRDALGGRRARNLPARKVATGLPHSGAIVESLPAFDEMGHRAVPPGNRSIAEDVRDRAGNEAMSLAVDQRDIPDAGKRVDSVGERAVRERLDGRRGLLRKLGGG